VRILSISTQRRDKSTCPDTTEEEKEEETWNRVCYPRSEHTSEFWYPYASMKPSSLLWIVLGSKAPNKKPHDVLGGYPF
jgi:hypothetical protein